MVGKITKLCAKLKLLEQTNTTRVLLSEQLLQKLYNMGIINNVSSLTEIENLTVSAFCRLSIDIIASWNLFVDWFFSSYRRRLPVIMVRLKMSSNLKEAATFIEQGQVRVGPSVITDPAFIVPRTFEDYVTWVDSSKIKRTIMRYNDKLDDFDLLGN